MRLGSSILGGKPMRIPGIIDVYQVGNEWIARSWPKVQNQPNSALQLLWRKKFKDAHATIKKFQGLYKAAYTAIQCPVGKMWIDIAMTSIMKTGTWWTPRLYAWHEDYVLYFAPDGFPGSTCRYLLLPRPLGGSFPFNVFNYLPRHGTTWADTMKWNDEGIICPKGKRPKKRWGLSFTGNPVERWIGDEYPYPPFGTSTLFIKDAPNGITVVSLHLQPVIEGDQEGWALVYPPVYVEPTLWTGW